MEIHSSCEIEDFVETHYYTCMYHKNEKIHFKPCL